MRSEKPPHRCPFLDTKEVMVPPAPLQSITPTWGPVPPSQGSSQVAAGVAHPKSQPQPTRGMSEEGDTE